MLWDQEKQTPSYKRIIFWVLTIHCIFITLLYFKNVARDTYLKPKLMVKNFVEKKVEIKKQKAASPSFKNTVNSAIAKKSSDSLWKKKREEFFKEKLEAFSQVKKSKEQAKRKEKERAAALVQADLLLRERGQNSQKLKKRTAEKKTFQKVLKKKSVVSTVKSGKKTGRTNEKLQKRTEQIKRLKESLAKLETSHNQKNKPGNAQPKNSASALKPLIVPKLKKSSWTASLVSGSSKDLFATQIEEHEFSALFLDYLKEQLQLPEKGEVKLEMQLSPEGLVSKIEVLATKSQGNKEYLEEVLPLLAFPFLKHYLKKEKKIIITFLNEE